MILCGAWMCWAPSVRAAQDIAQPEVINEYLRQGQQALDRDDFAEAQEAFEAILRFDPDHPLAKQFLKRVKAKEVMRQTLDRVKRQEATLRADAIALALQVAREKAKAQARQETDAQRQVQLARERQLKALYTKGVDLYHHGAYEQAIEVFQQIPLLDPAHPLVAMAQQLITKAETKLAEKRARLAAAMPRGTAVGSAKVSELEQALAAKRLEQETTLKYAKLAFKDKRYDQAIELVERVLTQEPAQEEARKLLHQTELAKLKTDEVDLDRRLERDDQQMINDVSRAELLTQETANKKPSATQLQPVVSTVVPPPVLSRLREPISFDFQDVALSDVLDFLADSASVSIIPSPRVNLKEQRVSLRVDNLPLEMALKYLVKNLGLAYRAEGTVLLIATAEEFDNEPLDTRVFFLRSGLGPFALETSAVEPSPKLEMESFKKLIEQAVTQPSGSKLVVDERSGSLIITNTEENLRRVEQLLGQLDVTPLQVLIEARFVEVTLTELEQRAVEGVLTGDYALTKQGVLTQGVDSKGPGNIIAKGGGLKFPALARESEGANITLQGVLTAFQFEAALHLLEETQKSRTLSAPRVTTLNNQAAEIKVVDEFRYPTRYEVSLVQFDVNGDGDFDDAGETEFVNVPKDFQKRDVGILLNVTPSVGKNLKSITLVLAPEVSQFSQFRDLGGGVTVPEFTSSQLTTSVVIEDGQTVVLGGLMKDTLSTQTTKLPILGDLPGLGGLFRQRRESQTRKNLLIFITARLLAPRGPTI